MLDKLYVAIDFDFYANISFVGEFLDRVNANQGEVSQNPKAFVSSVPV
jgi:hypothetical protein